MTDASSSTRVIILANHGKPGVPEALERLRPWLSKRAQIVAEPELDRDGSSQVLDLPDADLAVVLGGDGTLLAQAPYVASRGLPILGVNFGKLGFLAEFSLYSLYRHWDKIITGRCNTGRRLMFEVSVFDADAADCRVDSVDEERCVFRVTGLNDSVVTAGEPFRVIELGLTINPTDENANATTFSGDGVVISTPSGSTAHNISAGGPIVSPGVDAMCITPICAHSLAFRPIVINAADVVCIHVLRANEGTALVIDGHVSRNLRAGQQVLIRKFPNPLLLIHNPELNYWKTLAKKMHWAVRPSRG